MKVKKFFAALKEDPKAAEMLKKMERPETEEKMAESLAGLAAELGYEVSAEDVKSAYDEMKMIVARKSDKAAEAIEEMDTEDLDKFAGGISCDSVVYGGSKQHKDCTDSFKNRENCWTADGCDEVFVYYKDYVCKSTHSNPCVSMQN